MPNIARIGPRCADFAAEGSGELEASAPRAVADATSPKAAKTDKPIARRNVESLFNADIFHSVF